VCPAPEPGRFSCLALVRTRPAGKGRAVRAAADDTPIGYGPADLQNAYQLPSATAGTGRTVAVVDAYDNPDAADDLSAYRAQYGLPPCTESTGCFTKVDRRGGDDLPVSDDEWAMEIALDLDMVPAGCPNCRILLVEADSNTVEDLGAAVNTAVARGAGYVSNSYGGDEDSGELAYDTAYFDHPGVVVTAAAGDGDYGTEYPAASPRLPARLLPVRPPRRPQRRDLGRERVLRHGNRVRLLLHRGRGIRRTHRPGLTGGRLRVLRCGGR